MLEKILAEHRAAKRLPYPLRRIAERSHPAAPLLGRYRPAVAEGRRPAAADRSQQRGLGAAGAVSRMAAWWLTPLLAEGFRGSLSLSSIYRLEPDYEPTSLVASSPLFLWVVRESCIH